MVGIAGVAAALVAALAAGCSSTAGAQHPGPGDGTTSTPPSSPASTGPTTLTSVTDLAHGTAPDLPYWLKGFLHLGTRAIRMPSPPPLVYSSGGISLVVENLPSDLRRIYLVKGQRLVALQTAETVPVMSSDGRYAAWEKPPSGSLATVVLWDLSTGHQVASQRFHSNAHCCDAPSEPVGIDQRGTVYIWDGGVPLAWSHADQRIQRINGVTRTDDLADAYLGGAMFLDTTDENGRSRFGPLDADYTFRPAGSLPSQQAIWSSATTPDGERAAYQTKFAGPTVVDLSTGERTRLHLPEGDYVLLSWESEAAVLLSTEVAGRTYWIRCDASSGDCRIAQVFDGPATGVELPQDG